MQPELGEAFASAVAAKDHEAIRQLLDPDVDFRAMTPGRIWDADGPEEVIAALKVWFDDSDHVEAVEAIESDSFADRQRVGYRLRLRNPDGTHLVEQQAYFSERDGRMVWLRIMCSGFRPVA